MTFARLSRTARRQPAPPSWRLASACLALLLACSIPSDAAPPDVLFPASVIDSVAVVHLRWYTTAPDDPTEPATLPKPSSWLTASPDQSIALAQQLTLPADSTALYAIDLYARAESSPSVQLWSDSAGWPHEFLSDAVCDPPSAENPDRYRCRLVQPLHIRSAGPLWVVAILRLSSASQLGLLPPDGAVMLTTQYPIPAKPSWQSWPDYNLACALVTTRPSTHSAAGPADADEIHLFRATGIDTVLLAPFTRLQTLFSDLPAAPGADIVYIWRDTSGQLLANLEVPYSHATALAWNRTSDAVALFDTATYDLSLINRSSLTLNIEISTEIYAEPGVPFSGPLPIATVSPDHFNLGSYCDSSISAVITSAPAASGRALMIITAMDHSTASARPAACTVGLQLGITSVPARPDAPARPNYTPYPNPTNSSATLRVPLGVRSIDVFNSLGARIDHIAIPVPTDRIIWPAPGRASDLPSGVYLIRYNRRDVPLVRTLTIVK